MPASTYAQIQRQIARLQAKAKAIENAKSAKKSKDVQKVRQLMDKLGVTMSDLGAGATPGRATAGKGKSAKTSAAKKPGRKTAAKKPVPIRYRDPETNDTWTGRGRPPRWLVKRTEQGKRREDYLIAAETQSAPTAA